MINNSRASYLLFALRLRIASCHASLILLVWKGHFSWVCTHQERINSARQANPQDLNQAIILNFLFRRFTITAETSKKKNQFLIQHILNVCRKIHLCPFLQAQSSHKTLLSWTLASEEFQQHNFKAVDISCRGWFLSKSIFYKILQYSHLMVKILNKIWKEKEVLMIMD